MLLLIEEYHAHTFLCRRSMMSRPEKRVLQQKGILRERVFNCDLAEHLLNTGSESMLGNWLTEIIAYGSKGIENVKLR